MDHSDHEHREHTRQPNSRHCFVCGLESPVGLKARFDDDGVNEVRATYVVDEAYQGYPGVAHGGVIAALLDEAAGRTAMIADRNRFMFTARLEIRYRQPVPVGMPLTVVARLLKDRGRLAVAHSELRLPDGAVAAEADVTLMAMPGEMQPDTPDFEALGWRVYRDEPAADGRGQPDP